MTQNSIPYVVGTIKRHVLNNYNYFAHHQWVCPDFQRISRWFCESRDSCVQSNLWTYQTWLSDPMLPGPISLPPGSVLFFGVKCELFQWWGRGGCGKRGCGKHGYQAVFYWCLAMYVEKCQNCKKLEEELELSKEECKALKKEIKRREEIEEWEEREGKKGEKRKGGEATKREQRKGDEGKNEEGEGEMTWRTQ